MPAQSAEQGKPPNSAINPDEAVAVGVAVQAVSERASILL
jgi:molecular chaperone DnaK (HSP70)